MLARFAGNDGVTKQGVSPFPSEVTAQMVAHFTNGGAAINQICVAHDLGLKVFDLALELPTGDISEEAAMDERTCAATMAFGMEAIAGGTDLLCIGEMGIGNTTIASAIYLALFGGTAEEWVGPGTGHDAEGVALKADVIRRAVELHKDHLHDPLEVLRRLGGREIAAMAGAILAGRVQRIPVVVDGFVASAAAAILYAADPTALDHCLFAHVSAEPAHHKALEAMNKGALLNLDMRLGEGTGAALAAGIIKARSDNDNAVMVALPSDHIIRDTDSLINVLSDCAAPARDGQIVTIGITPTCANTGYGYIHCGEKLAYDTETVFCKSLGFREKPNLETAEKLLADGNYKWNSGMFVWSVKAIRDAFKAYAPDLEDLASTLEQAERDGKLFEVLPGAYHDCQKISIDYAVMEKVDKVAVAECSFDWDDVGSWTALRNQVRPNEDNNVVRGMFEGIDATDNIVVSDGNHLIAAIDVKDMIIIHTDDATLVCNAKSAQRIKELVHQIGANPDLSSFI